ncbi:hypothetical protein K440DRAFT_243693 [Wilcoxina mikolae CBS 423.85]|nr:hypothetical protein K440DRAFT_243693 [Wilcoxina mikolae CBS 423.85]
MAFSIEATIALISIVVSLPPAAIIIWKFHQRSKQRNENISDPERTPERRQTAVSQSNFTVVVVMREAGVDGTETVAQSHEEESASPQIQMS